MMSIQLHSKWLSDQLEKMTKPKYIGKKLAQDETRVAQLVLVILNRLVDPKNLVNPTVNRDWSKVDLFVQQICFEGVRIPWKSVIFQAIEKSNEDFLKIVISKQEIFNSRRLKKSKKAYTEIFFKACKYGSEVVVTKLLSMGLTPDKKRALLCAFESAQIKIVKILLAQDIPISSLETPQVSLLQYGIQNFFKTDFLKLLIIRGADPFYIDATGQNYLHLSLFYGNSKALRFFLKKGVDLAAVNQAGQNVLHYSAKYGGVDEMQLIMCFLSDPSLLLQKDKSGKTPLDYALEARSRELFLFVFTQLKNMKEADIQYQGEFPFDFSLFKDFYLFQEKKNAAGLAQFVLKNEKIFTEKEHIEWYANHICFADQKESFPFLFRKGSLLEADFLNPLLRVFNPWEFEELKNEILHLVVQSNQYEAVQEVVRLGKEAVFSLINQKRDSYPLEIAFEKGNNQIACLLLLHGAELYNRKNPLESPLWSIDSRIDSDLLREAIGNLSSLEYKSLLEEAEDGMRLFLIKLVEEGFFDLLDEYYPDWLNSLYELEKMKVCKYIVKYSDEIILKKITSCGHPEWLSFLIPQFAKYNLKLLDSVSDHREFILFLNTELILDVLFNKYYEIHERISLLEKILRMTTQDSLVSAPITKKELLSKLSLLPEDLAECSLLECAMALKSNVLLELCLKGFKICDRKKFVNRSLNADGFTPFMPGSLIGDADTIRLLIHAGADPFARTKEGQTILTILKNRQDISFECYKYIACYLLELIKINPHSLPKDFDLSLFFKGDMGQDLYLVFRSYTTCREVLVHKEILRARSKSFSAWLEERLPSNRYIIAYEGNLDLSEAIFQMYRGKIEVNYDNFQALDALKSLFPTEELCKALSNWYLEHPECEERDYINYDTTVIHPQKRRKIKEETISD